MLSEASLDQILDEIDRRDVNYIAIFFLEDGPARKITHRQKLAIEYLLIATKMMDVQSSRAISALIERGIQQGEADGPDIIDLGPMGM